MVKSTIQLLPEELINKIAAGEVIERPASVVKELVENAIDAGATKITVEVQGVGQKLVRVTDNGSGLTKEEIDLAIQRHSTSKIKQAEDLFNIQTLGFRGEALPSIASVSFLNIEPNPSGRGVTVKVKDLFYNTPARKKFLKSPATEMGHLGDVVTKYALARPEIAFELISDGKPLLLTSGSGELKDAVVSIYGAELAKNLVEVRAARIHGLISRPTLSRLDREYETFFVNGRYIKNFLLNRALEEAYRTLIPNNRYPVSILFLEIDPKVIDVNVHPTKKEIKFARTAEVMEAVREAVKESLGDGKLGKGEDVDLDVGSGEWGSGRNQVDQLPMSNLNTHFLTSNPISNFGELEMEISAVQPLFPIYQLNNTYIICTDGQELVLLDQHAAHERILYDQLSRTTTKIEQQTLLLPETLELPAREAQLLTEDLAYFNSLGFDLEPFGEHAFIIRAVPALAGKQPAKALLGDLVTELVALGRTSQLEVKRENIRKLVACHSAIKAGDKLTPQEMGQLIRDLYRTENPLTCPHGRPTMLRLSLAEIAKRFGR